MGYVHTIDGAEFLFDMQWMPLAKGEEDPIAIRNIADRRKAQAMVLHKERESYCLGTSQEELVGVVSAASCAARAKKGAWIAVCRLEAGRYWLIAAANGAVVSGTDKIFTAGQDAFAELKLISRIVDFNETFVAGGILEDDSEFKELELSSVLDRSLGTASVSPNQSLADQIRDGVKLAVRRAQANKARVAAAAAVLAVLYIGYAQVAAYLDQQAAIKKQQDDKNAADARTAAEDAERDAQISAVNANWNTRPTATRYQAECRQAIKRLSLPIAGWNWDLRRCDVATTVSFERDWGLDSRVEQLASERNATLRPDGSKRVFLSKPLVFEGGTRTETLLPAAEGRLLFQEFAASAKLQHRLEQLQTVEQGLLVQTRITKSVGRFEQVTDTAELAQALDTIPGLVVRQMLKDKDAYWRIEVEIYHEDAK